MTNVMTKMPARQRIIGYLARHNGSSASEISLALRVTAANIRHHLSILISDGRVMSLGYRPSQGRGRPVLIYGSGDGLPRAHLNGLATLVMDLLFQGRSPVEQESILENLASRLIPEITSGEDTHITRRLAQTITQLNNFGYEARWEAHAAAPRIIFENCPYAAVIKNHPELCRVDQKILTNHLKIEVEQTTKLEKNARGVPFCVFVLKKVP